MRILIYLILIELFLSGCEQVTFHEPQPAGTKALLEIPGRLTGNYLNREDNSVLRISNQLILRIYDMDMRVNKNDLDGNSKLKDDTIFNSDDNSKIPVRAEGDSLVFHYHSEDTLFSISAKNILKKFKGYYFMSTGDSTSWVVTKLYLSKGILSISEISTREEISTLRELTGTASDTTCYHFKPSKKQFRKFIKEDGFKSAEYFARVKD